MPTRRETVVQTVRAQVLGARMRELRESRGLTLKHVAAYLGVEFSTLARYERAEWPFRPDHVAALLAVYGMFQPAEHDRLVQLAREAWRVDRWDQDRDADGKTPGAGEMGFVDAWWLESRAADICVYAPLVVPSLVQTPAYAEAVYRALHGYDVPDYRVENWLALLAARQEVVNAPQPVAVTVLVEELVLSRPVGSPAVMAAQLRQLAVLAERPDVDVTVLVLPARVGAHVGVLGGFTVYGMPSGYPPVAYVEHVGGRLFIEAAGADRYVQVWDRLTKVALPEAESLQLVKAAALDGAPPAAVVRQEVKAA